LEMYGSLTLFLCMFLLLHSPCDVQSASDTPENQNDLNVEKASFTPHGGMMRYPDVSAEHIVFVYADDLWVVSREGGTAIPLASPDGGESFPRFSPDGKRIAFNGNYDGNNDLYIIPVEGGIPERITHHSSFERLCDWTEDGKLVFAMNGLGGLQRHVQLFTVSQTGGLPEKLPVPYGGFGVISRDGEWLAYTPRNRDNRTWKRYRGGWASDIWLFNLTDYTSEQITNWEGTDTIPMWHKNRIYYLSDDGPGHRLNIWFYDIDSRERKQVTHFRDYDIKWPSNGPGRNGEGEIIFEYNAKLYLLNLETGESHPVDITVPGARPNLRPIRKEVHNSLGNWVISPSAKRALVETRGDIWSLPAKNGTPRNLTRSSGVAEREPSWSPDGKWITWFSDESGEYELMLMPASGTKPAEKVTSIGAGFRYQPTWSPDSKWLIFTDHESRFHLFNVEKREIIQFDRINISGWRWGVPRRFSWSSDSQWITYTRPNEDNMEVIMLYNVKNQELHQVTSGMFVDYLPTFDRKGDFLYFFSEREISDAQYADKGLTFIYENTSVLHALPLRAEVSNPLRARSDEESLQMDREDEDDNGDDNNDEDNNSDDGNDSDRSDSDTQSSDDTGEDSSLKMESDKDSDEKAVEIELENMEQRAFRLPVKRGRFSYLAVNDEGKIIYLRQNDDGAVLQIFDPEAEKKEEKTIIQKVDWVLITPDGKKLLVRSEGKTGVIDAKADQKIEDQIVTSPMTVLIQPREEWEQIFNDAWRFMRDFFYDPNMHQVDWKAVRKQYESMLADCASRRDVGYVISEMISEVNASHTYYGGGDVEHGPSQPVGYLGADFELENGFYKISKFYEGGVWDTDARSVLHDMSETQRNEFQYIFAVNGVPVDTSKSPWAAFEGYSGQTVTLTVSSKPDIDSATQIVVDLLSSGEEGSLRYRDWVETNRKFVDETSHGRVGYIHVPDTAEWGQRELFRQFYGQMNKAALIIDDRWNGGGNIADRFIELLNRPIYMHIFERYENDWRIPTLSHQGPRCMLINGEAGSGGDIFPYLFRKANLGKLIGMRTWGGVIGIARNPALIDGARLTVPFITFYETDGTLTMEGHGVEPDIEVIDDPSKMAHGWDPQLNAAVDHLLEELEKNPYVPAKRPPYPDRSGMGIKEEDK
jgi:tricorn protease